MKEFDIPPIRDAVVLGRRASIGPKGLFESLDRMVPDAYELASLLVGTWLTRNPSTSV